MPLARLFDDGATEYLQYGGAILNAAPITVSLRVRTDDATADQAPFAITDNSAKNYFLIWLAQAGAVLNVGARKHDDPGEIASTTNTWSAGTWHHLCGIWASATSRTAILDGNIAGKGTNTNAATPADLDLTSIGVLDYNNGSFYYMSGAICYVGLWNIALTDAEVLWLARGRHGDGRPVLPPDVRPHNLVGYWPLDGNDKDFGKFMAYDMAAYNTPGWTGGPPRLIDTGRRGVYLSPAAPTFVPYPRPRGLEGGLSIMAGGMQ